MCYIARLYLPISNVKYQGISLQMLELQHLINFQTQMSIENHLIRTSAASSDHAN